MKTKKADNISGKVFVVSPEEYSFAKKHEEIGYKLFVKLFEEDRLLFFRYVQDVGPILRSNYPNSGVEASGYIKCLVKEGSEGNVAWTNLQHGSKAMFKAIDDYEKDLMRYTEEMINDGKTSDEVLEITSSMIEQLTERIDGLKKLFSKRG